MHLRFPCYIFFDLLCFYMLCFYMIYFLIFNNKIFSHNNSFEFEKDLNFARAILSCIFHVARAVHRAGK